MTTVSELMKILERCDPDMPVATHANNSDYFSGADEKSHGPLRVALCHHYSGNHVLIGNPSRRNTNGDLLHGGNWYLLCELDGGPRIPYQWWNSDRPKCPACKQTMLEWWGGEEGPGMHVYCQRCNETKKEPVKP